MAQQKPLMMGELSAPKQAALTALVQMPGWAVVEELHMEACRRATADLLAQDPAEGNDKKVNALQLRARERNEFSLLILKSVDWHSKAVAAQTEEENPERQQNPIVKPLYEVKPSQAKGN